MLPLRCTLAGSLQITNQGDVTPRLFRVRYFRSSRSDVTLYGAVVERWGKDAFTLQMTDSAAVSAWRKRMGSKKGKEIYKERSQLPVVPLSYRNCHATAGAHWVRGKPNSFASFTSLKSDSGLSHLRLSPALHVRRRAAFACTLLLLGMVCSVEGGIDVWIGGGYPALYNLAIVPGSPTSDHVLFMVPTGAN